MKTRVCFIALCCWLNGVVGQKTLQLTEGQTSPPANLDQVAWIAGHWKGEAFGGQTEEIWSPPMGNSMMFVFKLMIEGDVNFYEIGHILAKEGTLILQLKHFGGNLHGWEEKEETVDFRLVKLEEGRAFFEGFTFEKVSNNAMNIYVVIEEEGNSEEVLFQHKKVGT